MRMIALRTATHRGIQIAEVGNATGSVCETTEPSVDLYVSVILRRWILTGYRTVNSLDSGRCEAESISSGLTVR